MRSRLFWRRSAAAAGTYASAALGFGATVVALHVFSTDTFGRYALVLAATAFAQSLLDLTVEEALVKFGIRAFFLFVSMALRFTAIAVAAPHGLSTTIAAMLVAQVVATTAVSIAGWF